jgi:hypothetical protein
MNRRTRTALAVSSMVAAALILPSGTAGAATAEGATARPWLSLSQATGLRSGQIITVHGSGFGPGRTVQLSECPRGATERFFCSFDASVATETNSKGTFSVTMQVVRQPTGMGNRDCATRYLCEIGATTFGPRNSLIAEANVWFDAKLAPVVPSFWVNVTRNLTPNEMVTVHATGLEPNAPVQLTECSGLPKNGTVNDIFSDCAFSYYYVGGGFPPPFLNRVVTSPEGTLAAQVRANGQVLLNFRGNQSTPANCEVSPGCEISAQLPDPADPTFFPRVAISFDPTAKPITPLMTVSDSSGLADGQIVTVAGGPFLADQPVLVRECPTTTPVWENCLIADQTVAPANDFGDIKLQFPVMMRWKTGKDIFNCAHIACSISILGVNDIWYSAWTPITFNATLPPIRPKASVSPSAGLSNGEVVTVNANGYPAGASLSVEECVVGTAQCNGQGNSLVTDAAGGGQFGVVVGSAVVTFNPATGTETQVACGTSKCELVVQNSSDPQDQVFMKLSFGS